MEDLYDALLFGDEPPASVRERLDENPELARAWAHWRAARDQIRRRLDDALPRRRLLVLYALDEAGADDALTEEERSALAAARDDLERALDTIPALRRVVERIQEDREAFETAWAEQTDGAGAARAVDSSGDQGRLRERDERPAQARSRVSSRRPRRWAWGAAVAALVVGLAVVATLFWPQDPASTTVTVADGTTRVVSLTDASTVRLVGPASLTYPANLATAGPRRVTLNQGRGFFDVQRRDDETRFVVETPTATTTVLGTQFGVATGADTTAVVLAEGRVQLRAGPDSVTLAPGQRSRVVRGQPPTPPAATNLTAALDWTGLFVFRSTPVEAIAERLSRHYEVDIAVAPPLRGEPVTGTFEQERDVRQVLETLAVTLDAEATQADGQYRLAPAP